jgi:hypothetical protein
MATTSEPMATTSMPSAGTDEEHQLLQECPDPSGSLQPEVCMEGEMSHSLDPTIQTSEPYDTADQMKGSVSVIVTMATQGSFWLF